jgi:hypothetical protein
MPDYAKRKIIAAKSESTYGSDAFTGSDPSDYLAVVEDSALPFSPNYERVGTPVQTATHDVRRADHYIDSLEVGMSLPVKAASTAIDDPPPHDALLKAANLKEAKRDPDSSADSGDEYVEYFPYTGASMTDVPSATIAAMLFNDDYSEHYLWLAEGARHNLTWTLEMGEHLMLEIADGMALPAAMPTSGTASSLQPDTYSGNERNFVVRNLVYEIDGTVYPLQSLELSTNWSVTEDRDATQSQGTLSRVELNRSSGPTDSPPGGSMTLKGRDSVVSDLEPKIADGTPGKIVAECTAPNGTEVWRLEAPRVQFGWDAFSAGDDPTFDVPFFCLGTWDSAGGTQMTSGHNSFFIQHGETGSDFGSRA